MKKFWCISLIAFACTEGYSQIRYAGYILHERDQSTVPGLETSYYLTVNLMLPQSQAMPDSLMFQHSTAFHKVKEEILGENEKWAKYTYKAEVSVNALLFFAKDSIPSIANFNNLSNDTFPVLLSCVIQPDYFSSLLDTATPSNVIFPLVCKKGERVRFNAFNRHPEGEFSYVLRDGSNIMTNLGIAPDENTSEFIFKPLDTGYYFLLSSLRHNTGAFYESSFFYTVYVAPESAEIPSGYFRHQGVSYEDKFFSVYPDSPSGSVNLTYSSLKADSVKFNLLPLEKPYAGFSLSTAVLPEDKYSVNMSWSADAYINKSWQDHKGFINILVTKYRQGKPYYETFTVSFNKDTTSSIIRTEWPRMSIYPNPATDHITIRIPHPGKYSYILTGATGNVLKKGEGDGNEWRLSIADLKSGIYFLEVLSGSKKLHEKIVITE